MGLRGLRSLRKLIISAETHAYVLGEGQARWSATGVWRDRRYAYSFNKTRGRLEWSSTVMVVVVGRGG